MALRLTSSRSAKKTFADKLAERDAAQKDVFVREVDDALREQELVDAIRRYAVPVGTAVLVALLALGGYLWWNNHQADLRAAQAEQIVLALDKLDSGQQAAAFAQLGPIVTDGSEGNRAAARILQAGIDTREGKLTEAAQLFSQVAGDDHAPKPFRDLANLRGVALGFDTMPPDQVIARLRPLALPGGPYFGSAGELVGIAYLRQGHPDMAAPLFGAIAHDPQVPDSLRARARQLAGMLGFDAIDDATQLQTPAETPTAPEAPPAAAAPVSAPAKS